MTRVLALADQSKIGCVTQRRFAKVGTKTHPQRGAALDRNGLSVSTETACRFEPKSPVGNSEICTLVANQHLLVRTARGTCIASERNRASRASLSELPALRHLPERGMAFELPHFGWEQSEADGATPVSPVDAVDQQREPLMALLRACRPLSGGGVAQKQAEGRGRPLA